MKKINKIIPILAIASVATTTIPSLSSCNQNKVLQELDWDVETQGIDAYNGRESAPPLGFATYSDATQWYFDEVSKDYSIFTYDMINMLTHNLHEWAYNFRVSDSDPYGLNAYEMKCTHANVKLYKWDTVSHRISFDLEVSVANADKTATGHCKFSWINQPAAITPMTEFDIDHPASESYPHVIHDVYDRETYWRLMPEGYAASLHATIHGEVVDPYYPGGTGKGHAVMCQYHDWKMLLDETYDLPDDRHVKFNVEYTPTWYEQFTSKSFDDPENFVYLKYYMTVFYMNSLTYVRRIQYNQDLWWSI